MSCRRSNPDFLSRSRLWQSLASVAPLSLIVATDMPGSIRHVIGLILDRAQLQVQSVTDGVGRCPDLGQRQQRLDVCPLAIAGMSIAERGEGAGGRPGGQQAAALARHRGAQRPDRPGGLLDAYVVGREKVSAIYRQVDQRYASLRRLSVIQDNWSVHRHPDVLATLATLPRLEPVWLPTDAPWLNPIEKLWRRLTEQVLKRHRLAGDRSALRQPVRAFLDQFATGCPAAGPA